ncbi:MAG: hypothetical protein PHP25_05630, partial [Candidatus Moranbacteria bacterium]|nr:hypothetical protein [Candidatus Moranbacteria bacterium]
RFIFPEGCRLSESGKIALTREGNHAECNPSPFGICNRVPTDKNEVAKEKECPADVQKKCFDSTLNLKNSQK